MRASSAVVASPRVGRRKRKPRRNVVVRSESRDGGSRSRSRERSPLVNTVCPLFHDLEEFLNFSNRI